MARSDQHVVYRWMHSIHTALKGARRGRSIGSVALLNKAAGKRVRRICVAELLTCWIAHVARGSVVASTRPPRLLLGQSSSALKATALTFRTGEAAESVWLFDRESRSGCSRHTVAARAIEGDSVFLMLRPRVTRR